MEKLGIAVIGAGWMGELHALIFAQMPQCRVVAVVDIDGKKAESVASAVGARPFKDYLQALDQPGIDAVSVCTPDALHVDPILASFERGKHVLVEKPLTDNSADGQRILEGAERAGVKLMVGHLLRFDPRFMLAKKAIDNGEIGDLVHFYARRNDYIRMAQTRGADTNPVLFLGVHDIDLVRWLSGSEVKHVYAQAPCKAFPKEGFIDSVVSIIRFESGTCAALEFSWLLPDTIGRPDATLEIVGTKGTIFVDAYQGGMRIHTQDSWKIHDTMFAPRVDNRVGGDLRDELESFVRAVLENTDPEVTGQDGLIAVKVAEAILESARIEEVVRLVQKA